MSTAIDTCTGRGYTCAAGVAAIIYVGNSFERIDAINLYVPTCGL